MPKETETRQARTTPVPEATGGVTSMPAYSGPDVNEVAEASQRSLAAFAHMHSRVFRDALRFNAELLD